MDDVGNNMEELGGCFSELPIDLIPNILVKMAATSLLRCHGVCKAWRDVIDSPLFCKEDTIHLEPHFWFTQPHLLGHGLLYLCTRVIGAWRDGLLITFRSDRLLYYNLKTASVVEYPYSTFGWRPGMLHTT